MAQRQLRSDDTSAFAEKYGNGSDGAASINTSTDSVANTTFSASSGSTSATFGSGTGFADGNLILIHQSRNGGAGAGAWELNKIASGGGTTSVTLAYATIQAYDTTAQVYLLKQYSSVTINSGQTLTGRAWDGTKGGIVAFLCNGITTITGTISSSSKGYRGGAHPANDGIIGDSGEGTAGASVSASSSANGNGGGGGRQIGPESGSGGNGSALVGGGTNGAVSGNAGLTVMTFGGGGGGKGRDSTGGNVAFDGGEGGGIVLIISKTITITGAINSIGTSRTGAGAGAGGSVLLKGQDITLGSSLITATGGVNSYSASAGTGRIHADYATSLSGTTSPTIDSRQDTSLLEASNFFLFL